MAATNPPDLPAGDYPPEALAALQEVCYALELADPREAWGAFPNEVTACRARLREMAGLPRLAEAYWLPPAAVSYANREFLLGLEAGLRGRMGFSPFEDERLGEAAQEAGRLYWIWSSAAGAASKDAWVCQRRHSLGRLREALGPEEWWARRLPAPVPRQLFE